MKTLVTARKHVKKLALSIFGIKRLRAIKYGYAIIPGEFSNVKKSINKVIEVCYSTSNKDDQYWLGKLRQYAHILDKGLNVKSFEVGRSKRYYDMALEAKDNISNKDTREDESYIWAMRCIEEYEKKQNFPEINVSLDFQNTTCSYQDIKNNILTRRSVRQYKEKPLENDALAKILDVVNWAPSSCNRQTAQAYAVTDPSIIQECLKSCVGATCFDNYVPAFITFCADIRPYDMPAEFYLPQIDTSLGIQNCNLVANSLGVSITLLSWASHSDIDEKKLRNHLKIPDYCEIIINAVAGYPDLSGAVPCRKDSNTTINLV